MGPQYLQFAKNGIWEEALKLEIPASKMLLSDWFTSASDDVALEIFFGEASFAGLRLKPFQHQAELMRFCDNPSIEAMRDIFAAPELFRGKPEFAELGVVNAWKSIGAKLLWRQGEAIPSQEVLAAMLKDSSLWSQAKPIALELGYTKPFPHWRAVPVSQKNESGYRLNLVRLHEALSHEIDAE
jgi:hypothetical protein